MGRSGILAVALVVAVAGVLALPSPATALLSQPQLQAIAGQGQVRLDKHLPVSFDIKVVVKLSAANDEDGRDAAAFVQLGAGGPDCIIRVTPAGRAYSVPEARLMLLHELGHCLEKQVNPQLNPVPGWVGLLHTKEGDVLEDAFYCTAASCPCPGAGGSPPRLGNKPFVAIWGHRGVARVRFRAAKLEDACKKSATNLLVTGAVQQSFVEDGACQTSADSDGDLQIFFVHVAAPSSVTRQLTFTLRKFQGAGQYEAPPGSVVFSGTGLRGYQTFVRDEPPDYPSSGTVTITAAGSGRLTGTVSATMRAPNEPGNTVRVSGNWSCTPSGR